MVENKYLRPKKPDITTVRHDPEFVARATALIPYVAHLYPNIEIRRASVLRLALHNGLRQMEGHREKPTGDRPILAISIDELSAIQKLTSKRTTVDTALDIGLRRLEHDAEAFHRKILKKPLYD